MAITWTGVTFNAGFFGTAASSPDAGTNTTVVRLRGSFSGPASGVAWTQPAGSRPSAATQLGTTDGAGREVLVNVATNGNVTVQLYQQTGNEPVSGVILDGLTYAGEA
jgi:hypothetical protein